MMTAPRQAIVVPDAIIVGIQVLVVEDSAPIRELLANYFIKKNMSVTSVADGTAAIQTLERNRGKFDLGMTDLFMPGADGFAVLMGAEPSNPGLAVVICTGYVSLDSAIQAVRVGAYDYLPKPFKPSELQTLLNRMAADRGWRGYHPGRVTQPEELMPVPDVSSAESDSPIAEIGDLAERVRKLECLVGVVEADGIPTRG